MKRFYLLLCCVWLAIVNSNCYAQTKSDSFEDHLRKGAKAYADKDWLGAEKFLKQAIVDKQGEIYKHVPAPLGYAEALPTAYYLLGVSYASMNRETDAKEAFEKMVELDPNFYNILYIRVRDLNLLIDVNTYYARANLAVCYVKLGNFDKGIEEGRMALQMAFQNVPGDLDLISMIHFNLACAYLRKGDKAEALKYLRKAFNLDLSLRTKVLEDEDLKMLVNDDDFKKLLKIFESRPDKITDIAPYVSYNAACGKVLQGNKAGALFDLRKSFQQAPFLKNEAMQDEELKILWDDIR